MNVLTGHSVDRDAKAAVAEATKDWDPSLCPEILFVFASTAQDSHVVASELASKFPKTMIVGCTSTGEHVTGRHLSGSLVLSGLCNTGIRWAVSVTRTLSAFGAKDADAVAAELFGKLGVNTEDMDTSEYFCLSFMDGLRTKEEWVGALVADALQGVRMVGGSAGDDLAFKETRIIINGESITDAGAFVLGHGKGAFQILKTQHFTTTPRQVAVTKVDLTARRVLEIDGLPALEGYARALGMKREEVTSDVTFMNPLTFSCNGQIYVRAIAKVDDDGSFVFYSAVEEGMVLEIGSHHDLVEATKTDLDAMMKSGGQFDFFLGYNCILRALEADKTKQAVDVAGLWASASKATLGFDTYGEFLDGVQISQTLVGIGFHGVS